MGWHVRGVRTTASAGAVTYRDLLSSATRIVAGDTHSANGWLLNLAGVLKTEPLQPHQRAYLYRLRTIWKRRAAGQDARWNEFGSMPGAKPRPRKVVKLAPPVARPAPPVVVVAPDPSKQGATTAGVPAIVPSAAGTPPLALSSLLSKYTR